MPLICDTQYFTIRLSLNWREQSGESLADAHFTGEMRQVNMYCEETQTNVTNEVDIVTAVGYGKDVVNTVAEYISIYRAGPPILKCITAMNQGP